MRLLHGHRTMGGIRTARWAGARKHLRPSLFHQSALTMRDERGIFCLFDPQVPQPFPAQRATSARVRPFPPSATHGAQEGIKIGPGRPKGHPRARPRPMPENRCLRIDA